MCLLSTVESYGSSIIPADRRTSAGGQPSKDNHQTTDETDGRIGGTFTMDRAGITTISFDCYGTLINWEAGLLPALRSMLSSHRVSLADADILELYGEFEAEAETGAYQSYRKVLESVVRAFGERFTFDPNPDELRSLHESLPSWPPFSDTVAALRKLKERFRLQRAVGTGAIIAGVMALRLA